VRLSVVWPAFPADATGSQYLDAVRAVEDLGFHGVYAGDHIFGNVPTPDALTLLASFASITRRIRLGTAVLLPALRDPLVTAKQIATIDQMSEGRLTLGVGVGGEVEGEWRALGVPIQSRGARTDEYLGIMRKLWTGDLVTHDGAFKQFSGVRGSPLPAQTGGPPIWVGGRSDRAISRALAHQGWCAYAMSPKQVAERVRQLRSRRPDMYVSVLTFVRVGASTEAARELVIEMIRTYYRQDWSHLIGSVGAVGTASYVAERLRAYVESGADEIILSPIVTDVRDFRRVLPELLFRQPENLSSRSKATSDKDANFGT
jgi:probable F420-dependent oxidoreductase